MKLNAEIEMFDQTIESLAGRAQLGDEIAVNDLLARLRPYMRKLAATVQGQESDDLIQIALVAVWRGLSKYESDRPFTRWARQVGRRAMLGAARRVRRPIGFDDGFGMAVAEREPCKFETDCLPDWWVTEVLGGLDSRERADVCMKFGLIGDERSSGYVAGIDDRCRQQVGQTITEALDSVRVAFEVRYGGAT